MAIGCQYGVTQEKRRSRCQSARIIHDKRLALTPGARLGAYEVTALIGEGGVCSAISLAWSQVADFDRRRCKPAVARRRTGDFLPGA